MSYDVLARKEKLQHLNVHIQVGTKPTAAEQKPVGLCWCCRFTVCKTMLRPPGAVKLLLFLNARLSPLLVEEVTDASYVSAGGDLGVEGAEREGGGCSLLH